MTESNLQTVKPRELTIPISGMRCAACASRIEESLRSLPGVLSVTVDLILEKATITYEEGEVNLLELVEKVQSLGYGVPTEELELLISGMACTACASRVEEKLNSLPGVREATVNLSTGKARVKFMPALIAADKINQSVTELGYGAKVVGEELSPRRQSQIRQQEISRQALRVVVAAFLTLPFLIMMVSHYLEGWQFMINPWLQLALATPVQFWAGWPFYRGAYYSLKTGGSNMDVLVAMGTSVAYFYSVISLLAGWGVFYFEASAMLVTVVLLGKLLEAFAKGKTSNAIEKLVKLQAKTARVLRGDKELNLPVEEVKVGDLVLVRPGERIPVDGIVLEGNSSVDEAIITGESLPIEKEPGSEVIAGSINKHGSFTFRATKVGADTTLSQIIRLVEQAQEKKAPIQRLADRASRVFVPAIIVISLLTFGGWYLSGADFTSALMHMVTVLVVACPCALGLATPTAIMVGAGMGAERGILIKGGEYLEQAGKVDTVVLDKTGTITQGIPTVTDVLAFSPWSEEKLLQVVAAGESKSEHPLGQAVVEKAKELGIPLLEVNEFVAIPGQGIQFKFEDKLWQVGNEALALSLGLNLSSALPDKNRWEEEGKTVMAVVVGGELAGLIAVADTIKSEAREAISELKQMGLQIYMLTGDQEKTARAIAAQVGIDEDRVVSQVFPHNKAQEIEKLKAEGHTVAMVGDGINDAPALSEADIGIAISTGTDVAIESAAVVLMGGDIRKVATAIRLSRQTLTKIKQNLFWAVIYNGITIPLAIGGIFTPVMAGAAMALSSVSVVTNSLLLKRYRPDGRSQFEQ